MFNFLKKTKTELNDFFQFEAREPLLFFVDNRKDIDLIWGKKTEEWFVGAAKNNSIFIFHPKIFEQVSCHKKEKFWNVLKHEFCHIYYTQITKSIYPVWLNEGLASYISGKKLFLKDEQKKDLLNIFLYFKTIDKNGYSLGQYWVECLLQKFGKDKFIQLIKTLPQEMNEKKFADIFYKIYGYKYNKIGFKKILEK